MEERGQGQDVEGLAEGDRAILDAVIRLREMRERVKQAQAEFKTAEGLFEEAKRRLYQANNEQAAEFERFLGLVRKAE